MSSQSAKELVEELNRHRIEVSKLRNALNEIDKEKEFWFKKKQELSAKIRGSIQKIKDSKAKRDSLTSEVKALKPNRDSINKDISPKLSELEKLKKEKDELAGSIGVRESPSKIKQQMEKLEFRIETEAISFDKEREIMKKIKELRKVYGGLIEMQEAGKKWRESSESIRKMRKDANELHKSVQEKAKHSQALHEEILKASAEIDRIKAEEEDAFKKFSELKGKFSETNAQLKEKLKVMNDVKSALDKISYDRKERRKQEVESFLKSKEEEVNQKIKRGEKLTTEDLLVFQKFEK